jgi:hypothetical protein
MYGGVGNLIGYLWTGWWFHACTTSGVTRWTSYWGLLSVIVVGIGFYFLVAYRQKRVPAV